MCLLHVRGLPARNVRQVRLSHCKRVVEGRSGRVFGSIRSFGSDMVSHVAVNWATPPRNDGAMAMQKRCGRPARRWGQWHQGWCGCGCGCRVAKVEGERKKGGRAQRRGRRRRRRTGQREHVGWAGGCTNRQEGRRSHAQAKRASRDRCSVQEDHFTRSCPNHALPGPLPLTPPRLLPSFNPTTQLAHHPI